MSQYKIKKIIHALMDLNWPYTNLDIKYCIIGWYTNEKNKSRYLCSGQYFDKNKINLIFCQNINIKESSENLMSNFNIKNIFQAKISIPSNVLIVFCWLNFLTDIYYFLFYIFFCEQFFHILLIEDLTIFLYLTYSQPVIKFEKIPVEI